MRFAALKASCLDGSFTVSRHDGGMTPTDCSLFPVPKTPLIRVAATDTAIVVAVALLSPRSLAIGDGFGDKLNLRSERWLG